MFRMVLLLPPLGEGWDGGMRVVILFKFCSARAPIPTFPQRGKVLSHAMFVIAA